MDGFWLTIFNIASSVWVLMGFLLCALIAEADRSCGPGWFSTWSVLVLITAVCSLPILRDFWALTVVSWLPLGICWMFIKWYCRINGVKAEAAETNALPVNRRGQLMDAITMSKQKALLTSWVLFWPVSIITTCFADALSALKHIITVWFGKFLEGMAADTLNKLK